MWWTLNVPAFMAVGLIVTGDLDEPYRCNCHPSFTLTYLLPLATCKRRTTVDRH